MGNNWKKVIPVEHKRARQFTLLLISQSRVTCSVSCWDTFSGGIPPAVPYQLSGGYGHSLHLLNPHHKHSTPVNQSNSPSLPTFLSSSALWPPMKPQSRNHAIGRPFYFRAVLNYLLGFFRCEDVTAFEFPLPLFGTWWSRRVQTLQCSLAHMQAPGMEPTAHEHLIL